MSTVEIQPGRKDMRPEEELVERMMECPKRARRRRVAAADLVLVI